MKSTHQINIENYHQAIASTHPDHNMYIVHRDWHENNPEPTLPSRQDPEWGINLIFGENFLQMHHEMVKAINSEPKTHMMHASIVEWYKEENIAIPTTWHPLSIIPDDMLYEPDPEVFPVEIRTAIEQFANASGQTTKEFLTRTTDNPIFELPKYFTIDGVSNLEEADPLTGSMKLADFVNANQLGCSLVFPHNEWHGAIGGAMSTTWTAIADPIFYFGVHWHIDLVFDEFKLIERERSTKSNDLETLRARNFLSNIEERNPKEFSTVESTKIKKFMEASKAIRVISEFIR